MKRAFLSAAAALIAAAPALAQTSGAVRGEVRDPSGAPLPGVTLTLRGETSGLERLASTGDDGAYFFAAVPAGGYSLLAELEGMGSQRAEDVRVSISGTATVNFVLGGDAIEEEMTVTADKPLLDLGSSQAPTNYQSEFIEDLPTRRNFWDLVAASPGMSQSNEENARQTAFGSSIASNSWNVDGLNVTGPETGGAWWYINPETIEEVQVLGIGASAEYGNMTGAAINVVTKSGTNDYRGAFNSFLQFDELTDTNVELDDPEELPFAPESPTFERDRYHNLTMTFGGPLRRERAWFFAAAETFRDSFSEPGVDASTPPEDSWERFDLKVDFALGPSSQLDAKYHYEDYAYEDSGSAFVEPSARGVEFGTNPAWGAGFSHVVSGTTLFEAHYAGWWGDDFYHSATGSDEPAFADLSPPDGGPTVYTGGLVFPFDYDTYIHQGDVKLSHLAEDFLHGDHDFRFGVQYSYGSAKTLTEPASGGGYYYHYNYYGTDYYYLYTFTPFFYGGDQSSISAYADDAWRVTDRLTLNAGVRYDRHTGSIPSYRRLDAAGEATDEALPEVDDVVEWGLISPRLGFAYVATDDQRTVVRGSFGVYHDGNVSGNWNYPPPSIPPIQVFFCDASGVGCDELSYEVLFPAGEAAVDPDLDPPRSLQYALGLERQIGPTMAIGAQLVYKETDDLVGWEILGDGIYQQVPFVDPLTGEPYTLLNICPPEDGCRAPTIRKGNRPGEGSLAPDEDYQQDYRAAILSFERRHAEGWSLMGSYTYSRSEGLVPRATAQTQGNPFYGSLEGSDPNSWINADQLLQNDREHMLRLQADVQLPWNLEATGALNWQTGRPYSRQGRAPLDQGGTTIILEPASDDQRLPSTAILDVGIGKRFALTPELELKVDLQVLNLLNEDAQQFWETLRLPGDLNENDTVDVDEDFVPDDFVYPRRAIVRLGLEF